MTSILLFIQEHLNRLLGPTDDEKRKEVQGYLVGAKLTAFIAGETAHPLTMYSDAAATTAHPSPIIADVNGNFPPIYAPPGQQIDLKLTDRFGHYIDARWRVVT